MSEFHSDTIATAIVTGSVPGEWVHYTRHELDAVSRQLFKLYLLLAHTLSAEDWDLIDRMVTGYFAIPVSEIFYYGL
jgi:hypothetical protein